MIFRELRLKVSFMPSWKIHDKWAEKLGIRKEVSMGINREIDNIKDARFHDIGRVIISGKLDFSYFYPVLKAFYMKWRSEEAIKAFLLHHILDYMNTLLTSPSVSLSNVPKFLNTLIKELKIEAETRIDEDKLKIIVIKSCNEIYKLIMSNMNEVIIDIKPKYKDWFKWAEERLLKLYCSDCGRQFTTIDNDAREFLARKGVGIPPVYFQYCINCLKKRGDNTSLSLWIEKGMKRPYTGFVRYMLPPPLSLKYWRETRGKAETLIYILRKEEVKELDII